MCEIKEVVRKIKDCDAILIGASNGFSIAEGLNLFADNQAFEDLFGDFKRKYGLRCILHGMGAMWPNEREKWAFWSKLIYNYCIKYKKTKTMEDLRAIVSDKDYFVVTSNGEGHFQMGGFEESKVFEIEGKWLGMVCEKHCHKKVYSNVDIVKKIMDRHSQGKEIGDLIPVCQKCGAEMAIDMEFGLNALSCNEKRKNYYEFIEKYHNKKIVVLELGIGFRNQLIKAPFMDIVEREKNATYITINLGEVYIRESIKEKSFGLDGYIEDILGEIREEFNKR